MRDQAWVGWWVEVVLAVRPVLTCVVSRMVRVKRAAAASWGEVAR